VPFYTKLQTGKVRKRDMVCALCFLCSGSKSTKLAFAYNLYDKVRQFECDLLSWFTVYIQLTGYSVNLLMRSTVLCLHFLSMNIMYGL
jgi:hypothetical protein